MKIYAILNGSDWVDASVEHLVMPEGLDIREEQKLKDEWYQNEYLPRMRKGEAIKYLGLKDWLINKGAKEPTSNELEEFWEY